MNAGLADVFQCRRVLAEEPVQGSCLGSSCRLLQPQLPQQRRSPAALLLRHRLACVASIWGAVMWVSFGIAVAWPAQPVLQQPSCCDWPRLAELSRPLEHQVKQAAVPSLKQGLGAPTAVVTQEIAWHPAGAGSTFAETERS